MNKTYTINGKQYTEFDLNKRCAELEGISWYLPPETENNNSNSWVYSNNYDVSNNQWLPNYCTRPDSCSHIIQKCWNGLMDVIEYTPKAEPFLGTRMITKWELVMQEHNCDQLVAACIYYVEQNDD